MKKLEKISEILERNTCPYGYLKKENVLMKIAEDFKTKNGSHAGAKGMTMEQVVRVAILKQKKMTLNENIKRISPEVC